MPSERLTFNECIRVLSGRRGLHAAIPWLYRLADYPTRGLKRLGIPPLRFTDGPKGVNLGRSTCFPVTLARGASWDAVLEKRIGAVMAKEAAAQGANALGSTCINVIRHPGWGRAQESYSADPVLLSRMGVALMTGIQSENVLAVIKHFACNSIENSRFKVSVEIDSRALHEIYLPHFKACVDAGAAAFMAAYNKVNGQYCGHSHALLTTLLRTRWGFDGFVMSDFLLGIRGTSQALNAGLDMEMPRTFWFSKRRIKKAVTAGRVEEQRIREAAGRVVAQLRRFGLTGKRNRELSRKLVGCDDHQKLSLESSRRAIVLLQNRDNLLPLKKNLKLAVIGPFGTKANLGSEGSASVRPPRTTSLLEGLRKIYRETDLVTYRGLSVRKAARIAATCDVAVLTVGLSGREEGEYFPFLGGGDRNTLELPPNHIELIHTISQANANSIVILFGGSAFACGKWINQVKSILVAWYPGMHGGQALAEIMTGEINPSGRLPLTFPRRTEDLPHFNPRASKATYDLYHDYRWVDKKRISPAFPFGFGLSYTVMVYKSLAVETIRATQRNPWIHVAVDVENTGDRDGVEVVQLYLTRPSAGFDHPHRELKAFERITVAAGKTETVHFHIGFQQIRFFNPHTDQWEAETGRHVIGIGPNAFDQPLAGEFDIGT